MEMQATWDQFSQGQGYGMDPNLGSQSMGAPQLYSEDSNLGSQSFGAPQLQQPGFASADQGGYGTDASGGWSQGQWGGMGNGQFTPDKMAQFMQLMGAMKGTGGFKGNSGKGKGGGRERDSGKSSRGSGASGRKRERRASHTPEGNIPRLHDACRRILKRSLVKEEVCYDAQEVVGGYQASVRLPELSVSWGIRTFAGEVGFDRKDAESRAAGIALQAILMDPELGPQAEPPAAIQDRPPIPLGPQEGDLVIGEVIIRGSNKAKVSNICTRLSSDQLTQGGLHYETHEAIGGFQSLVTLKPLPGDWANTPIAGEILPTQAEAEESAAKFAIEALQVDESILEAIKVTKGMGGSDDECSGNKGATTSSVGGYVETKKLLLNNYILKVVPRALKKGDIDYKTMRVEGGYQATVQCYCLRQCDPPSPLAEAKFAGEVCASERDAVHSAAGMALEAIKVDPDIAGAYAAWLSREERLGMEPKLGADGQPLPKRQKKGKDKDRIARGGSTYSFKSPRSLF